MSAPEPLPNPSSSWLSDLRAGRPGGWRRVVEVFDPVVRHWCRQAGLQPADADDVTQEVFAKVRQGIASFRQGNFVGWLHAITHNAVRDHFRRLAGRPEARGGTDFQERLAQQPAPEDGSAMPESARLLAVRRVMDVVRGDVEGRTWRAFEMVVVEGRATKEVAAALGMTEANVRLARSRVLARIREELGAFS
jgi:RNA polymerase sigma-70 factor (ECF subfamily)